MRQKVLVVVLVFVMLISGISNVSALTVSQLSNDSNGLINSSGLTYVGGRFYSWPVSVISSITIPLFRQNSPAGTVYVRVRRVSDNVVLGTLGSVTASSLPTAWAWYTFNTTAVVVATSEDIRIAAEWSGGTSSVYVGTKLQNANVYAGGCYSRSYTDLTAKDWTFKDLTYSIGLGLLSIDAVSQTSVSTLDGVGYYSAVTSLDGIQ